MIGEKTMASKGKLPIEMMVYMVLAIIFLGFVFGIVKQSQDVAERIAIQLGWMSDPTAQDLVAAIECSYLRCKEGCNAVTQLMVGDKECKTVFCDPYKDEDDKVCGNIAMRNPVEISLEGRGMEGTRLKLSNLDFIEGCPGRTSCCIPIGEDIGEAYKIPGHVWIRDGLVYDVEEGKSCVDIAGIKLMSACSEGQISNCAARSLYVLPATYYVWTDTSQNELLWGTWGTTYLWDSLTSTLECEDTEVMCPKCEGSKISPFRADRCLSAEICEGYEYTCNKGECGAICTVDEDCVLLGFQTCNVETCQCEGTGDYSTTD